MLFPRVYEINASKTSIDELLLERKILEEKINEVRENRVGKLINKVPDRTEPTKRASDAAALNTKESIQKEKEYNEERLRLQNETLKKQLVTHLFILIYVIILNIDHIHKGNGVY